jgi:hypothetical protein
MSGRSGWASSPALRPPCASDPTALPTVGPLGVGERQPRRLPPPASASGPRTLRRDSSCGPRGGCHHHPPVCSGPASEVRAEPLGGWAFNPPGGWVGHPLRRPRGPQRAGPGWSVGDAALCGHRGAPPRAALLGRGLQSLGAKRAGVSKRRAAPYPPGKKNLHAVEDGKRATPSRIRAGVGARQRRRHGGDRAGQARGGCRSAPVPGAPRARRGRRRRVRGETRGSPGQLCRARRG